VCLLVWGANGRGTRRPGNTAALARRRVVSMAVRYPARAE
jgi:hypothetical protein